MSRPAYPGRPETVEMSVDLEPRANTNTPTLPLHDRIVLWTALTGLTVLSWLYLIRMPMAPADLGEFGECFLSVLPPRWTDTSLIFMMWTVMMVAMMIPSAAPMMAMYSRIARSRQMPPLAGWVFISAYIVVWTAFSALATAAQIGLEHASLISPSLSAGPFAGAVILALAGVYQLSPLKEVCLGHCRSPLGFLMAEWREGIPGAFFMGLRHGAFCVGCCWMLMLLLFVLGVMNLLWVAILSALILLEKASRHGRGIARAAGVAMIVAAAAVVFRV